MLGKPTHRDGCFDFESHHHIGRKVGTAGALAHGAQALPGTHAGGRDELNHIASTLKCIGYPEKITKQVLRNLNPNSLPSPEELFGQFRKRFADMDKPNGYVTLPYISGITEGLRRILQKQNIRGATKPLNTAKNASFP